MTMLKLKWSIVFFLTFFFVVTPLFAQSVKIDLTLKNATLKEFIDAIEEKSEYTFMFDNSIDQTQPVNISVKQEEITSLLKKVINPEKYSYEIIGNQIILKLKGQTANPIKNKKISGTIIDENGEPVIGATVSVDETLVGTITDINGQYTLEVPEGASLTVSYLGYLPQKVKTGNQSSINITLKEDNQLLEEVVVVGYGMQKKINLTGAIESISSKSIENKPVTSLAEALTGTSAGLTITQSSAQPGSVNTTLRVRGVGTWDNASPLVLVDGIEMNMFDVVPSDVEMVTVLKDAASASIYGSRAANGVILITTKKGTKGKIAINYTGNVGYQLPTRIPKTAKSWQYAELYNQAMANNNKSSSLFPQERIDRMKAGGDPDKLEGNTNWFDELLKPAIQHNHNITAQGGGEKTTYLASIGYLYQDGVIFSSYNRYNARINTNTEFTPWLKIGMNIAYINDKKSESAAGAGSAYYKVPRTTPNTPVKFSDGTWSFASAPTNPVRMASEEYGMQHVRGDKISVVVTPELNPVKGLFINGLFGYETKIFSDKKFEKIVEYDAFEPAGQAANLFVARNTQTDKRDQHRNLTASLTSNYENKFGNHYFKVMIGGSLESFKYAITKASRKDFPNNDFSEINAGDPNTASAEGYSTYSSLVSAFGRINYSFGDKYLFEANLRRDGSSKFYKDHRWGTFPSFSVGWRLSEEQFFEPLKKHIQNLKFRASWGRLGNQQIDDYMSLTTFGAGALDDAYILGTTTSSGFKEDVMGNTFITWETSTNLNFGLDFSVLANRLTGTFDLYKRTTDDILLELEAPAILGIKPAMQNAGSVENKGWEISLNWNDKIGNDFRYSIGATLSDVKNKVTDLKGYKSPTNTLKIRIEGEPIDALYGWETIGICKTQEDFDKYQEIMKAYNPKWDKGDLIIKDRNGDGKITAEDKTVIGNQIPRYTYSLNFGFEYKKIDFSCVFQGIGKRDGFIGRDVIEPLGIFTAYDEHYTDSFDPLSSNPNMDAYYPRILGTDARHNYDKYSHWVQNASYLRLKNIQLGYTFSFPKQGIDKLRVMFSGQNLFTITKYRIFDPENGLETLSFPNVAVYSLGASITF